MSRFKVEKAVRQKLKAAVTIIGASGSGKTLSALMLAYGLMKKKYPDMSDELIWEKIGLVDTEHERGKIYVDMVFNGVKIGNFQYINFTPPYDVDGYDEAQRLLVQQGCEVVILDSISHAWEGEGGMLELQQDYGGTFQSWKKVNPHYRKFIDVVTGVRNNVHTISTIRAKQDYQVSRSEVDGKLEVIKLGLKPVQRDSLEYEMQVVFNIDMKHIATVSKDNTGGFFEKPRVITPEDGGILYEWLEVGEDIFKKREEERNNYIKFIRQMGQELGEPLQKFIAELEEKAKTSVEDMKLEWLEKAYELVNNKMKQLEKQKQGESKNGGNKE